MPSCENCGEHVSNQFAQVFGTNDDQIHGCPQCHTKAKLAEPNLVAHE